jgi:GDP-mannose 4,6-dehydratase
MKNKKVLVTGGCGFIGSTLVRQLISKGYYVTILDNFSIGLLDNIPNGNKSLRIVAGDIRDFEMASALIKEEDYVIHLAAQAFIPMSYDLPVKCADVNALGSLNVFKACLDHDVKRIVHISSSEVYGHALYTPMDEEHPLKPRSTYAVAKMAADLWAQTMAYEHKLPVVILRPFNTYGPRDTLPRFIPESIRQCFKTKTIKLGNLNTARDYTYVEDTTRAMVLALETDGIEGEIINFGTGKSYRMSEIIEMTKKLTGATEKEIIHDPHRSRPADVNLLMADWSKAEKLLGWKPEIDFSDGLKKTIDWYAGNGSSWGYEKRGYYWSY